MKYSFLGFALIMSGILGLVFISMFQSITVDNESEYYTLKEAMEASMLESIDMACYRNNTDDSIDNGCGGVLKISEQKFVENFTKRFANNVSGDIKNYTIEFYDIVESPPKATVAIKGLNKNYGVVVGEEGLNIVNSLSGILEFDADKSEKWQPITGSGWNYLSETKAVEQD